MRATHNPYNPGAGGPPPELAGRDVLIEQARVAIARAKAGRPAKSTIMLGLRGVGKTVLINHFEALADEQGCQTAFLEIAPDKPLAHQLAPQLQHILHRLDRLKKAGADLQKAFATLNQTNMMESAGGRGTRTKIGSLVYNTSHINEHYGNLVTYLRLNGMVPPSSGGK